MGLSLGRLFLFAANADVVAVALSVRLVGVALLSGIARDKKILSCARVSSVDRSGENQEAVNANDNADRDMNCRHPDIIEAQEHDARPLWAPPADTPKAPLIPADLRPPSAVSLAFGSMPLADLAIDTETRAMTARAAMYTPINQHRSSVATMHWAMLAATAPPKMDPSAQHGDTPDQRTLAENFQRRAPLVGHARDTGPRP